MYGNHNQIRFSYLVAVLLNFYYIYSFQDLLNWDKKIGEKRKSKMTSRSEYCNMKTLKLENGVYLREEKRSARVEKIGSDLRWWADPRQKGWIQPFDLVSNKSLYWIKLILFNFQFRYFSHIFLPVPWYFKCNNSTTFKGRFVKTLLTQHNSVMLHILYRNHNKLNQCLA